MPNSKKKNKPVLQKVYIVNIKLLCRRAKDIDSQ